MSDTTDHAARLVLNDDTVICRDWYEPDVLELKPGPGARRRDRSAAVRDLRRRRQQGRGAGVGAEVTYPTGSLMSRRPNQPQSSVALMETLPAADRRPAAKAGPLPDAHPAGAWESGTGPRRPGEATDTRRPRC